MSLARLSRAGVAVPSGFCITQIVFHEHLERNDLTSRIKSVVEQLAKTERAAKGSLLAELRRSIAEAPMAEEYRNEIETGYRELAADRVAVRSSATAEDMPEHSFAGQYDTYLGVSNIEDSIDAVKKCWASLWTLRAYEYRDKNGFDHLRVSMAVIIQLLVNAETSGVIFTANPITGSRGSMVIEACFGLGEALVSGKVTPDRYIVEKKKLKLHSRTISEKKIQCVLDGSGTTMEQTLSNDKSVAQSLHNRQINQLAGAAVKIEAEFGSPQDIEWAISGKKIYLLQSRPITALPPEKSWEDRQIWCCYPAKEVMPDVITPATSSMIASMLDDFIDPIFRVLSMNRGDHPIYGLVAGRIYFNANIWGAVFRDLPGTRDLDFLKLTGSHKGLQQVNERLRNASDEDLPDMKFKRLKFFLRIPLIIAGSLHNSPSKGKRILTKVRTINDQWSQIDTKSLTTEEIASQSQKILADSGELLEQAMFLFSILSALPFLDIVCTRWLKDGNALTGKLLAGIGGMVDATAGLDIWRLASSADSKEQVRDMVLSNDDWNTIENKLSETDSGREFLTEWGQFMRLHGHHCRGELELYNKRWIETPDYILKFVRGHITQMDRMNPVKNFAKVAEQRRELEQQCRKQLRNPIKRTIFNHLLVRAQQGSVFRENVKSEVIKLLTSLRRLLIELGKRLDGTGILENSDDIFFLRLEELGPVVEGKADFNIRQVIAARRAEYNKNSAITPPDVVFGKFDTDNYVPEIEDELAQVLTGLGVSPGRAVGKARVILRSDTDEQLMAGEILVAPFTDPGWTPYFVPAVAIVMDEGGVISHGSIVAREYGIPAVVNVGGGTRIIKTGRTIEVDGDHGLVRILD